MLKNNKIFMFFLIFLFSIILLCSSVYAAEESIDYYIFNGFDGVTYNVPSLPSITKNYSHFILVKIPDVPVNSYLLFLFNDNLGVSRFYPNEGSITIIIDNISESRLFQSVYGGVWEDCGVMTSNITIPIDCVFINSCDDVSQYLDELNNEDNFFYNPPTVENQDILVPIIQETPLEGVLKEILAILPITLMIIVGLIGLRKALSLLFKVLRRS